MERAVYAGGTKTLTNTWDADSNRVAFEANGNEYEFVYDPTAGIPAVIQSVGEGSTSTAVVSYFREPDGSLICRVEDSTTHYYHFDALGSTRLLTNAGETVTVTDRYSYDAYGALLSHDRLSGSIDQPYQYVGQLGYYTHYQEPDFGLPQLGVRFYDPEVGRFTQRDRVKNEWSPYVYVKGACTALVDPTGRCADKGNPWEDIPIEMPTGLLCSGSCSLGDASLLDWWNCAHEMVAAAQNELLREGWPGMHNGPGDAMRHCIGSCKTVAHCSELTAKVAGYGHEGLPFMGGCFQRQWNQMLYGEDRDTLLDEVRMDLHNNAAGRGCGCQSGPGAAYSSCYDCCLDRYLSGDLRWLPHRRWSSSKK